MHQNAALFGRPTLTPLPRNLVQIKAGKMTMKPDNWVHSDQRKGLAYLYQTHDGQLHFCWIDRRTGFVEENYLIKPKEAKLKRVAQTSNNRVYCLKSKNNKRLFLWMQERYPSCDEDFCTKVNKFINEPPTTPFDYSRNIPGFLSLTQNDLMAFLSNGGVSADTDMAAVQGSPGMFNRQLGSGGATGTGGAGAKGGQRKIQLSDLRNIVNSINPDATSLARSKIDLNDALNVKELNDLIEKPEVQKRLKEHMPTLPTGAPESSDLAKELKASLNCSQFKSTLKSFSSALGMRELGPVISQFNLGEKVNEAAKTGDMVEFAKALQGESSNNSADTKKDDQASSSDKQEPMDQE